MGQLSRFLIRSVAKPPGRDKPLPYVALHLSRSFIRASGKRYDNIDSAANLVACYGALRWLEKTEMGVSIKHLEFNEDMFGSH